jgi:predicted transcriptional regulator
MTQETLTEVLNIRIAPATRQELERIADANRFTTSLSQHARIAIEEYVERETAKLKELTNA